MIKFITKNIDLHVTSTFKIQIKEVNPMTYTVQELAQLAHVSTRTLRYYDELGVLKPSERNKAGYRLYGQNEVNRLQDILFYKELGIDLKTIQAILSNPQFDRVQALYAHHHELLQKKQQLNALIQNVEKTLAEIRGGEKMSDQEKFEGFKKQLIEENEAEYGKEIRRRYGDAAVDFSNRGLQDMTKIQYETLTELEQEIKETLLEAFQSKNPKSEAAQHAAELHKDWISHYWPAYSEEAHARLADMYVSDERFKHYYDEKQEGLAEFLREAIYEFTGRKKGF